MPPVPQPGGICLSSTRTPVVALFGKKLRCSFCLKMGHSKTKNGRPLCPKFVQMRSGSNNSVTRLVINSPDHNVLTIWQFPEQLSQSTLNRGIGGSNACALISMLFAHKFMSHQAAFICRESLPPVYTDMVRESIIEDLLSFMCDGSNDSGAF